MIKVLHVGFLATVLLAAEKPMLAQPADSSERVVWPKRFMLRNAGTDSYLGTPFGGSDANGGLVQHAKNALRFSASFSSAGVRLKAITGLVVGVPAGSNKPTCPLSLQIQDSHAAQFWKAVPQKDASIVLRNTQTNLVMAVKDGSLEDFAQVVQVQYTGGAWQRWKVVAEDDAQAQAKAP